MFGLIDFFMVAKAVAAPGQQEWEAVVSAGPQTFTFTVPLNVRRISMVCAGYGRIVVDGVVVCNTDTRAGIPLTGQGGGNGGPAGTVGTATQRYGGGGGSGGYTGDGGKGGNHSGLVSSAGQAGAAGAGGGGGGGGSVTTDSNGGTQWSGAGGGGVGLKGIGTSGAAAAANVGGRGGSGGENGADSSSLGTREGGRYGGGLSGGPGAPLRWTNDVTVNPGSVVTVTLYPNNTSSVFQGRCGARILWGAGRSYPSNAGDV